MGRDGSFRERGLDGSSGSDQIEVAQHSTRVARGDWMKSDYWTELGRFDGTLLAG